MATPDRSGTRTTPAFLDEMDDRFTAATAPIQGKEAEGQRNGRWWHDRYPRRVFGQPGDELPPSWSPAPEYIEDD
ncbi:hypothetical protein ACFVHS_30095 [Streptomyces sp. NPDC057746]|uniref:hypothetical protein n=1 Tax=Streptomyces sp. NPDC057746 TaxID=3346237 RepID=UPI00369A5C10